MISIAAELAAMHPQTPGLYERRGLLQPQRSAKTRDPTRVPTSTGCGAVQELTELGLNLAGVGPVLELERELATMREQVLLLKNQVARAARRACTTEGHRVERSSRRDLVPLGHMAIVHVGKRRR